MADARRPAPSGPRLREARIPRPTGKGPRRVCDACIWRSVEPQARHAPRRYATVIIEDDIALCAPCLRGLEAQTAPNTYDALVRARRLRRDPPSTPEQLAALHLRLFPRLDPLRPPAPGRRPRSLAQRRRAARPEAPGAPVPLLTPSPVEIREYIEIPRLVRDRAGRPKSTDHGYLQVVTAAFTLFLALRGRRRDHPTAEAIQAVLDRWEGRDSVRGPAEGRRLHNWFRRHFGDEHPEQLTLKDAIADARRLRDADQALRAGGRLSDRLPTET